MRATVEDVCALLYIELRIIGERGRTVDPDSPVEISHPVDDADEHHQRVIINLSSKFLRIL
jgi:hypothetical protein